MASPVALLAWAAIAAYLSAYYTLLFIRRPSDREYLAFALLTGGFAIYSSGNAFVLDAETLGEAIVARRISNIGITIVVAFFIDFQAELRGVKTKLSRIAYAWAVLGFLGDGSGVFLLDHEADPIWAYGGRSAPLPAQSILGMIHTTGNVLIALAGLVPLIFRVDDGSSRLGPVAVRIIGWAGALTLLAGTHDTLIRAGYLSAHPLVDHVAVLFLLSVSYALLDRFVRESSELRERTGELAEALEELRDSQRKLVDREQLAAVGELSAVIAHEIRNPLAIIKNASTALRRDDTADGDRSTLRDILDEETERLQRLVHDLLAYSRPVVPQSRALRVAELVKRSVDRAKSGIAHADDIEVEFELEGPEHVHGDPELLRHALVNVIENAFEAMQGGGTLEIRAKPANLGKRSAIELAFQDSGEGMDTLVRGRARNPFFTTRPSGTGLGLAIVERVVRNHGGDVSIESMHGRGTTVVLLLPCEADT